MDEFRYECRNYDLKVSIALANSGDVQLEFSSATMCRAFTATISPPATGGCGIGQAGMVNYYEIRECASRNVCEHAGAGVSADLRDAIPGMPSADSVAAT
jgi:hypothetical protein